MRSDEISIARWQNAGRKERLAEKGEDRGENIVILVRGQAENFQGYYIVKGSTKRLINNQATDNNTRRLSVDRKNPMKR